MKNRLEAYIILSLCFIVAVSCGGSDSDDEQVVPPKNEAPTQVKTLIYPSPDLLCIDNIIGFEWTKSTDPDNDAVKYQITISSDRAQSQIVKQLIVSTNVVTIDLEKGAPYYWSVIAIDSNNNESSTSVIQAFYTSGLGVSNHAPFTSILVSPDSDSEIDAGAISLSWTGGDPDPDDILIFELFFGESETPPLLEAEITASSFEIDVVSGKTYYWKVNTIDESGVKTIGQIWNFTTN